jgi:hypothetical protein
MRKEENVDKKMVARAVIQKLQDEGSPKEIKTNYLAGFKSPERVMIKGTDVVFIPDIVADYGKETCLYEIELSDDIETDKWKWFSLYAKKNNGNLYLVIPNWLRKPVKQKLNEQHINAGIIYFNTTA